MPTPRGKPRVNQFPWLVLVLVWFASADPAAGAQDSARVAIIIDDIGFRAEQDLAVFDLDRRITVAVIPDAPLAGQMARLARSQKREALVHLPLAHGHVRDCDAPLCPQREWSPERMRQHLDWAFGVVEGAVGINNHQGSLFTADSASTRRLLEGLRLLARDRPDPLLVIDSRTSPASRLARLAAEAGFPTAERSVFLDHDRSPAAIARAWQTLLETAERNGSAIAIGHPHPETTGFLQRELIGLRERGIELVPISALVRTGAEPRMMVGQPRPAVAYPGSIAPSQP